MTDAKGVAGVELSSFVGSLETMPVLSAWVDGQPNPEFLDQFKDMDQDLLAELKTMDSLSLNGEYKCKIFPAATLTVEQDNIEENFNALNISGHDDALNPSDTRRACELICRRQLGAAEFARIRLDEMLKMNEKGVSLSEFVERIKKEIDARRLNCWEWIYLTFASGTAGVFSIYFSYFVLSLIIVSTVSFILETEPSMRYAHGQCVCDPIPLGGPCAPCEPTSGPVFDIIETVCISVFTAEYLIRLFTVHSVRASFIFNFGPHILVPLIESHPSPPEPSRHRKLFRWFFHPMVIIDLLAILPFYLTLILADESVNLSFLRTLRLLRVFRIFKLGKYSSGLKTFVRVLVRSKEALAVMVFFVLLGMVLFGSVVFFAEGGDWVVDAEHPDGYYQRFSTNQVDTEMSPFRSIASSFWWVMVTVTTVGYGDFYPTSPGGKAIGAFTMVSGILTLALPITVISSNYATEVASQTAKKNLKELEEQNKRRRQHVFANKSAAARNSALMSFVGTRRKRGNPTMLLTILNQIDTEVSWPVLPLLEGEARAVLAARNAHLTESQAEGEVALDRYYLQSLTLLRTQPSPLTDKHTADIRRELLAYYSSFTYAW